MPSQELTKQQQAQALTATTDTSTVTPTAVTVMASTRAAPTPPKHERANCKKPSPDYVSPLKKLKTTMNQHERRAIDTIGGSHDFIANNDTSDPKLRTSIRVQVRLLWTAAESIRGLHFLRLYLGEPKAPEPLHHQQQEYQEAQRDEPFQANQFLITLSLYDVAADDPSLPPLGSVHAHQASLVPRLLSSGHEAASHHDDQSSVMQPHSRAHNDHDDRRQPFP